MPDPQSTEFLKKLVSDRLKRIDALLKERKIEDAHEEIREIRGLDPTNPYARAYEERINELKAKIELLVKPSIPQPIEEPEAPEPDALAEEIPLLERQEDEPIPAAIADDAGRLPEETASPIMEPEQQPGMQPAPHPVHPAAHRRGRSRAFVVIVDDNAELLEEFESLLEEQGFAVAAFGTADEAYTFMVENIADLIICDVHLETSSFGGFTFYEKIRELEHLRDVPFLFLSGLKDSRLIHAGKELGADDYLTKPIDPEELLAVIRGKLRRYRQIKKK